MARHTLWPLFQPAPDRSGLRGDPDLREASHGEPITQPLACAVPVNIQRFNHGGMSAGMVHPETRAKSRFLLVCRHLAETLHPDDPDCEGPTAP